MIKAKTRNQIKVTQRLLRILRLVANTPEIGMVIRSAERFGMSSGNQTIKYIEITFPDREPLKAAYIIGHKSTSLESLEAELNEIIKGFAKC